MANLSSLSFPQDVARCIKATSKEVKEGSYTPFNIQNALEALHQDGFVVLKSIIDIEQIDRLNQFMTEDADVLIEGKVKPFNQGVQSNILQGPPVTQPEYLYNNIYFNPFVIQVLNAYLGTNPIWNMITGNNALPHTHGLRQPVHKDITFFHPQCPFYVIANIPLCDFNASTGATEFWLGSHAHTTGNDQVLATPGSKLANAFLRADEPTCNIRPEVLEQRRKVRLPIQPICEKGDVMLRDLRTWHAGMPNESDQYRIMIALGYQARWYPNHILRSKLPLSQANFFMRHGGLPIEVRADLLTDDADFGKLNDIFDFRPSEEI